MDQQTLDESLWSNIKLFFQRIVHKFFFGNTPFPGDYLSAVSDFSSSWGLPYDSHPGPVADAIADAKNLNKSLFIFIYCRENTLTQRTIAILSSPSISQQMQRNYIFLPLDFSTVEGHKVRELEVAPLPIIALVRPRGNSLHDSQIFFQHGGKITAYDLQCCMTMQNENDQNDQTENQRIIDNQDEEYERAVADEEQRQRDIERQEEERRQLQEQEEKKQMEIEQAFNNLPQAPNEPENKVTVKFQMPNNEHQIRSFPRDGSTSMLFIFVRHFVYPNRFILRVGFPPKEIEESDVPLSETISDRQFICYVELE